MTRLVCWLLGHDDALTHRTGLLRVSCGRCGRDSRGVDIGSPRFTITQRGGSKRARARILRKLQLASINYARHEAAA